MESDKILKRSVGGRQIEFRPSDDVMWLYVDNKITGSFFKSGECSVTIHRDGSSFYGFYSTENDLDWLIDIYTSQVLK
jgi:hypothetical protein